MTCAADARALRDIRLGQMHTVRAERQRQHRIACDQKDKLLIAGKRENVSREALAFFGRAGANDNASALWQRPHRCQWIGQPLVIGYQEQRRQTGCVEAPGQPC